MGGQPWLKNYPVRWNLDYPEISIYRYLAQSTSQSDDLVALVYYDEEITFEQMHDRINRFAAVLAGLGVSRGERVALMLSNCPDYIYAYYATLKLNATVVQVNPLYTPAELKFALKDSDSRVLVCVDGAVATFEAVRDRVPVEHLIVSRQLGFDLDGSYHWFDELLEKYTAGFPEAEISPKEDVAVYQYTGGTTGFPKAAMLTHYNIVCNIMQRKEWYSEWVKRTYGNGISQQYVLAVVPFYHSYGMTSVMNISLTLPAGLIIMPRFEVEVLFELIDRYRPKIFPGVPTIYTAIANHPDTDEYNFDCLEICNSGGAPIPVEIIERFEERTGARIIEGYGLTETSPGTHANPVEGIRKFGSIGLPYPDTNCKLVDLETGTREMPVGERGELAISGPQVMKGYLNRPEETAEVLRDGWLYTGDIATMDAAGYFYIVDRKKDMVITGALNVYPREVDEVLFDHPKIAEAICIGVPHDYFGEVIKAYIVLKNGENATEQEILDHCAAKLAVYKLPRIIEFRKELPKSTVGKLLRRSLK